MRPDKSGNYDGAHGLPRKVYTGGLADLQPWYDEHYDHAIAMLAKGVTPSQLMRYDPDLTRIADDYRKP